MTREAFIADLKTMGLDVVERDLEQHKGFVVFPWTIPVGRLAGTPIMLGLQVSGMNPPGGPHVSPHLLPLRPVPGQHPNDGVHPSPLGNEWQYWSRPFPNWRETDRSGRAYMAHINHLFDTL
jgi:hypothetical protein